MDASRSCETRPRERLGFALLKPSLFSLASIQLFAAHLHLFAPRLPLLHLYRLKTAPSAPKQQTTKVVQRSSIAIPNGGLHHQSQRIAAQTSPKIDPPWTSALR